MYNLTIAVINFLFYILFRITVTFLGWLPFWFLYLLSDGLYWLLYKLIGYRKKVVRTNLSNAFPNKSEKELKAIEEKFYHHLFDLLIESIKGFSLSKETLLKRQQLALPNILQSTIAKGRSIIVVGGHYGNWEWGGMSASYYVGTDSIILYSPVKNKYIDAYIKRSRGMFETHFWASHKAPRAFKAFKDQKAAFILIADQSPSNPKRAHWMPFLNQDTAILKGPAAYAKQYNLPLLFIDIQRIKRGYYKMEASVLTENPTEYTTEELTRLHVKKLEEVIQQRPELWLWSHRRWKHSRESQ